MWTLSIIIQEIEIKSLFPLIHSFLQDGRLRSGDHILRIGDTDLYGLGSEQVAQVLRQCGNRVKLLITRAAIDDTSPMPAALPTVTEQQVNLQYA